MLHRQYELQICLEWEHEDQAFSPPDQSLAVGHFREKAQPLGEDLSRAEAIPKSWQLRTVFCPADLGE